MTKKEYLTVDKVFALLSIVLGYFFIRWCFLGGAGIGATAVSVCLLILEAVYFIFTAKNPLNFRTIIAFVTVTLFSAGFCMTGSPLALFFNFIVFSLGAVYVCFRAYGNGAGKSWGDLFFFDLLKSAFVIPFSSFPSLFPALFSRSGEKKERKNIRNIFIGFAIAIFPVFIVTALLASADMAFSIVLKKLIRFDMDEIFTSFISLNLAIPVAMYFFGILYGNAKNPKPEILNAESAEDAAKKAQFIPRATAYGVIIPLILVYIMFFAAQCIYFVSAFSEMLPADFSYAQYARQGFFELCTVCIINFVVICLITAFTKRIDGKEAKIQRLLKALLCLFTEALIVIDIGKMFLYIGEYGLTQKRVVTSWFMILLGILFLLLLLKQIFTKFKITLPAAAVSVILSAVLIFGNVDGLIAKYNVSAYQSKRLESVDISAMYELDDSAIKYVLTLTDDSDPLVSMEAKDFIKCRANEIKEKELYTYTLHTFYAEKLLSEKGFIK